MAQKVKITKKNKTMKDPDVIDMFNKMIGTSEPDPQVVIPKYEIIMTNSNDIIKILETFMNIPFLEKLTNQIGGDIFKKGINDIGLFVTKAREQLNSMRLEVNDKIMSGSELFDLNSNPEKMKKYITDVSSTYKINNLGTKYIELKNSDFIKEFIMTARLLKASLILEKNRTLSTTHNLEDKSSLSSSFILNSDGDFLKLFSFSSLDFKIMLLQDSMIDNYVKYVLLTLHLIYKKLIAIIKEITSPDVDADEFANIMINNIDEIRKHIPRCDKAFNKIKQSVGLLRNNFGEYYKDFISSHNPGIIVENFIVDVAKDSKADISTTRQFREILSYYKKNVHHSITDPKIKKVFSMLEENLSIVEVDDKNNKKENTDIINKNDN